MANQTFPLDDAVRNQGLDTQDAGHSHNDEEGKRPTSAVGDAVGEQVRNVRDAVGSAADQAWRATGEAWDRAGDRIGAYADTAAPYVRQARRQGERGVSVLEDTIAEHPLVSIGIAVGVGFLLGRYLAD